MKLFLPIIVIALLNLFHSVSSLPMDIALPLAKDDAKKIKSGDIVDIAFARVAEAAIFIKKIEEVHYFVAFKTASGLVNTIHGETLKADVPGLQEALSSLTHSSQKTYTHIETEFHAVILDMGIFIYGATGVKKITNKVVHDEKGTRLEGQVWKDLLRYIEANDFKPRAVDVKVLKKKQCWNDQPPEYDITSESASRYSSQLQTPTPSTSARGRSPQNRSNRYRPYSSGRVVGLGSTGVAQQRPPEFAGAATDPYAHSTLMHSGRAGPLAIGPSQESYHPPPYPPPHYDATATGNEVFPPGQEGLPFHEVDQTGVPFASGSGSSSIVPDPNLSFHHNLPEDVAFARYLARFPPS